MLSPLRNWTRVQRNVAAACFSAWMLDAFDFFILVFVLSDLAGYFHSSITCVLPPCSTSFNIDEDRLRWVSQNRF